ncbi:uncharacterized protein MAM_06743 [Metarhizium album ARSEF 1941]|uniref:MARVEL-like domain protein n=1 Tax=Metarhizium album (strain ARSEF 1941) TaxID=1081103 RepID=A0A0B2WHG7_METAS|nr:uncharacterized protein MAM_06743 [Metarhizium album ARSEF 1941]KHN95466.1 hypothetical protein MAM_06743 [Metarhizium album ARSEF 1941]
MHEAASSFRAADKKQLARSAGGFAFSQGAAHGKGVGKAYLKTIEMIPCLILRGVQLVAALVVIGFYGNRISSERAGGKGIGVVWLYGVVVGGLSALTAILFALAGAAGSIPFVGGMLKMLKVYRAYPWDATLCVAWLVAFGVFGGLFMKRADSDSYRGSNTAEMKAAMWFDLVNANFWLVSAIYGCFKAFVARKADRMRKRAAQKMFGDDPAAV